VPRGTQTHTHTLVRRCVFLPRFELENHAHDIYDLFHSIHKTAVKKSTFFHWDEMVNIIRGSHASSLRFEHQKRKPKHAETAETIEDTKTSEKRGAWVAAAGARPIMGPDVMVSNLWEIRDFWEWLFPGHKACPEERDVSHHAR
jgi:hypothetical protein